MRKLDETIANLRLLLAQVEAKEAALAQAERQAGEQLKRVINFTLYEGGELERALLMMDEIAQRRRFAQSSLENLRMLKERTVGDLKAMMLTKVVEDARAELADLRARQAEGQPLAKAIAELEARIAEASAMAGRLITPGSF